MSETALIEVDYVGRKALATKTAEAIRETALSKSALIAKVTNADEQQLAVSAQMDLERIKRDVEKAEEIVKKPLNEMRAAIIQTRKDFCAEIETEGMRLAGLINEFQCQERERAAAERRAAEAEARRIAEAEAKALAEAAEKARLEREANERKAREEREVAAGKAREEAAAAAAIKNAADRKIAEAAAAKRAEEARVEQERRAATNRAEQERRAAEAQSAIESRASAQREEIAPTAPAQVAGQVVRTDWKVEVTDIHLLYRAHSSCVKLEPRIQEIKSLLDAGVDVKGVRASKEVSSGVRLGRERKAIEA